MPHHSFAAIDPRYRGFIGSDNWALCVGAGLSFSAVPQWEKLTRRVFAAATDQQLSEDSFRDLYRHLGWGLDAMLQAGLNAMVSRGRSRDEFISLIEHALYDDLLVLAERDGLRTILAQAIVHPKAGTVRKACELYLFLEKHFGRESVFAVAHWLRATLRGNPPSAVLTFNGDGLLELVLTLSATHAHNATSSKPSYPKDEFYRVLRGSDKLKDGIPIFYLHGCIAPKVGGGSSFRESRENLVFPESGYSRISSTVFTWQQTVFLSHAQSLRLVFIGVSMSDLNLRRWLSWCTASAAREEQKRAQPPQHGEYIRGRNLWITKRPMDAAHERALESSLLHLGTRIAWLDDWTDLPAALSNLSGT